VPTERETEQERLDRIERLINRLTDVSGELQRELEAARRLAVERRSSIRSHISHLTKTTGTKKR
jgi:hypothetical protein